MSVQGTPHASPIRSPSKRRIETITKSPIVRLNFSPVKIPNGRAGLKSPEKRLASDLDQSARKRANVTLHNEETYDEDDYLNQQDRLLAERIIRQSRGEADDEINYGSDVEVAEDLTTRKPRRTRSRKLTKSNEVLETISVSSDDNPSDATEEFKDDTSVEVDDEDVDDEEFDDDEEEEEVNDVDDIDFVIEPSKNGESSNKTKKKRVTVGRPTRNESVASKVKSIFQQDDELFEKSKKTSPAREEKPQRSPEKPKKTYLESIFDQTYDRNAVPIISGIAKSVNKEENNMNFEPLPIPKLDAEGNIADDAFIEKYFNGVNPAKFKYGRFLDDKVFFLEGSEGYFEQQGRRNKIGGASLTSIAPQLDYDEFYNLVNLGDNISLIHKHELHELHKYLYHQWCFEMSQGFNLNFYGIGSKIDILKDFAQNFFGKWWVNVVNKPLPKILVINGYNPSTDVKKLIWEISTNLVPSEGLPKHVSGTVPYVVNYLNESRSSKVPKCGFQIPKILLIVNNFDGEAFRVDKLQALFSQLMNLPEVWAMSSTDHINAPLLWDSSKLKNLNFIWHDLTTYTSYQRETSFKDVVSLGRSKKFVGGIGAKFVLRSLTENHRNVYRELMVGQLDVMDKSPSATKSSLKGNIKLSVDFKTLYNTCLNEFIVSNEATFRTFLKEYIEHKMCQLVKDVSGVEKLFIPFSYDEIQNIYKQEFDS
ncbi:ORC2 Origin recognition complex subunit 2 [Candida maltosa Xu316]